MLGYAVQHREAVMCIHVSPPHCASLPPSHPTPPGQQRLVSILGVTPCTPSLSSWLPIFLHLNVSSLRVVRCVQGSSSLRHFERRDDGINIAGCATENGESGISTVVSRRQQRKKQHKADEKSRKSLKVEGNASGNARESKGQGVGNRERLRVPVTGNKGTQRVPLETEASSGKMNACHGGNEIGGRGPDRDRRRLG